jgi:hypothetical protein
MAEVRWTLKADNLFGKYMMNAFLEYGRKTSQKWMQERIAFADHIEKHPESYNREALLADKKRKYRSCMIMGRFKIIHYYAKTSNTVRVVDIWDTRQSPENLKKRIR